MTALAFAASAKADDPILHREQRDGIALITLNLPASRNSLSLAMLEELIAAFAEIGTDRAVRAVVLAAAGPASPPGMISRNSPPTAPTAMAGAASLRRPGSVAAR